MWGRVREWVGESVWETERVFVGERERVCGRVR